MDAPEPSSGQAIVPLRSPCRIKMAPGYEPSTALTRDFSNFPFRLVNLTDEERKDSRFRDCLKFQVTHDYAAYIPLKFQNYIKPQHIYREQDLPCMEEARKSFWGKTSDVEKARYRDTHSDEYRKLDNLWDKLNFSHTKDHKPFYSMLAGKDFANKLETLESKRAAGLHFLKKRSITITGLMLSVFLFILVGRWKMKKKQITFITKLYSRLLINFSRF